MPIPRERLRLRPADREDLLAETRTAHCGTVSASDVPHVVPLWFVWDGEHIWINSLRRSRRGSDLTSGSGVSFCIDTGTEYQDLRGIVFEGRFQAADPGQRVRALFGAKYWGGQEVPEVRSHDWLRLEVAGEVSWDFRRIREAGRDPRLDAVAKEDS